MLKAFAVSPGGALKSIPLNAVPPEAWHSLTGGGDGGDVISYYKKVPQVYRGVNLITASLANMPWEFHALSSGDVVEKPRLPFAFNKRAFMDAAAGDYLLYGAMYWHKGVNGMRRPTLLKRLHPNTITPKYDELKGLIEFERRLKGLTEPLPVEDVAYVWFTNREAELGPGTPPVKVALNAAGLLAAIDLYGTGWFENGAQKVTLLFFDGNPSDGELDKIDNWLKRRVTGLKNAGRILGVRTKPEIVEMGDTPDKMALPELTDKKREDVNIALGIPQSMSLGNAANYATARQDAINFYDQTINPLALTIGETLTESVFSVFGLELKPHPERLEIYQAMEAEKADALHLMIQDRIITGNEFREAMNLSMSNDPALDEYGIPKLDIGEPENDVQAEFVAAMQQRNQQTPDQAEMRQWLRYVEKRLRAGKALNRPFETQHIPAALKASIEGALEGITDVDAAKSVFADAMAWEMYP